MEYNFGEIERKWQKTWIQNGAYKVYNQSSKPKYYVLDMFPYPSGAGLHVGHPLGYIASDIYARFKRLKGFNVLHPMGYDAFGLPAEQYAIEHGIHPKVSTENNINNFRKQLDQIGFCYDWDREVRTCEPNYYKWTQWIFLQLFHSWFNRKTKKAENIQSLIQKFETEGSSAEGVATFAFHFSAEEWKTFSHKKQEEILMEYRLAFCGYGEVNWCEALGTVLANDEVVNGVSERGGHPVVKKKLRQWYLRITEYADRLLEGLQRVDFSDAMKEMQTNWIGKSTGAEIEFIIRDSAKKLTVYTTRPDTIFGVDFMVVAPEHDLIQSITSAEQKVEVEKYIDYVKSRSERERQAEKKITGCFTGAYAINPFNGAEIPIWISEYVLAGYGTGAIMAVPCGDDRDFKFAKHFNIPITNILGDAFNGEEANPTKDAVLTNSGFLNGIVMRDAIGVVNKKIEELGIGKAKVNYRMRDAAFSRQRYWGEPFPIVWKDGVAYPLGEESLPLDLPQVDSYSPGPEGEGPLANIPEWVHRELETNTMPGYAGSSWYFLRYMDPHNNEVFADRKATDYWNQVDVYIGGTEHAVGHLLYSRLWTKVLFDLGHIGFDEPFKKLVNQGMITGVSQLINRLTAKHLASGRTDAPVIGSFEYIDKNGILNECNLPPDEITLDGEQVFKIASIFYSADCTPNFDDNSLLTISPLRVPIKYVNNSILDIKNFVEEKQDFYAVFVCKEGYCKNKRWFDFNHNEIKPLNFKATPLSEKMSKSKLNTEDPTDLVNKYGADTFRMYEMFLGPVEQSKPWDTKGIEGVHRFLRKLWRLFFDELKGKIWNNETPTDAELKVLHKAIKKIEDDTERFSYNTAVSAFMVCVNELSELKCNKRSILEPLLVLLTPYAPHVAEELWQSLGNTGIILDAAYPVLEEKYLVESAKEYPVSINGKLRTTINISLDADAAQVEAIVLSNEVIKKWLENKPVKKFIFVKGKMVNVVI